MKKLLLMLMLCIGIGSSVSNAALTKEDLNGLLIGQVLIGNGAQRATATHTSLGQFKINSAGRLYIENFLGSYNMPCELEERTLDGTTYDLLKIEMDRTARHVAHAAYGEFQYRAIFETQQIVGHATVGGAYKFAYDEYEADSRYLLAVIEKLGENDYRINLNGSDTNAINGGDGFKVHLYNNTSESKIAVEIYNGVILFAFKANAVATDYKDGELVDTYPVRVEKYSEGGEDYLEVRNWMNGGIGAEVTPSSALIWDANIGHPSGKIDYANNTVALDPQGWNFEMQYVYEGAKYYKPYYYYWTSFYGNGRNYVQYSIAGMKEDANGDYNATDPIEGTFDTGKTYHKNYQKDAWVTDGGSVTTHASDFYIDFGPYMYFGSDGTIYDHMDRTVITSPDEAEVTAQFEFAINQFGANDKGEVYVNADIIPIENCENISDYEIMIVPKSYTSIKDEGFTHSFELGHTEAVSLKGCETGYRPNKVAAARAAGSQNFNLMTKLANPAASTKDYTLFVKANYNNGLEPTFHNLSAMGDNITSAEQIRFDANISIEAKGGEIVVSGANDVEVFTISGTQVYAGGEGSIAVAPGIYVVKADGKVEKVNVK